MEKGGYKIINFRGTSISDSDHKVTMSGLYAELLDTKGKAILISNAVLNSKALDECFSTVVRVTNAVNIPYGNGYFTVDNNNKVWYTEYEGGSGSGSGSTVTVEKKTYDTSKSISGGSVEEITVDISTIVAAHDHVYFLNFRGADGTNYKNFALQYAFISGNNLTIGIRNTTNSSDTMTGFGYELMYIDDAE